MRRFLNTLHREVRLTLLVLTHSLDSALGLHRITLYFRPNHASDTRRVAAYIRSISTTQQLSKFTKQNIFFYGGLHLYLPSLSAPCVPTVKIEFWSFCEIGWRTYVSEHAGEDKSACHMPPCTRTSTHTLLSIHTSQTHGHAFEVP